MIDNSERKLEPQEQDFSYKNINATIGHINYGYHYILYLRKAANQKPCSFGII